VTCHNIDGVISSHSGDSGLPPEAAEHVAGCDRCRRLMRLLDEGPDIPAPSASQLKQIQSAMIDNLKPVRPLAPSGVFLLALAVVFLAVVAAGPLLLGMNGWRVLSTGQKIAVLAALATGAVPLAQSMVGQMAPGSKSIITRVMSPAGILLSELLVLAAVFQPQQESAFVSNGLTCMKIGLMYSMTTAFLVWILLRRGGVQYPKLMGAAAGGFTGLVGLSVLEIICPNLNEHHILVWHWGVTLLSSLGGASLGATIDRLSVSARRPGLPRQWRGHRAS
jgi:hypothetical protein